MGGSIKEDGTMTREEKIAWLKAADTEKFLKQYETSVMHMHNCFEIVAKDDRYTIEGIWADYELARAEMLRRLGA